VDQLHPQELRGNLATVVVGAVAGVTMARPAEAFAQEAFQFIDELGRLTSVDDVVARTGNLLARFGFEFFAFTGLEPAPDQTLEDLLLAGRFPDGFRERYTEHDYGRADPNVYRALCSSHPYRWTWSDYSEEDGPRALEVMQFFKDFHLNDGFIVPIHGPGGYEAGAAMAGEAVEMAPEAEYQSLSYGAVCLRAPARNGGDRRARTSQAFVPGAGSACLDGAGQVGVGDR
jgi:LuxR family quorum sensing-dependent transcriptional regulator